MANSISLPGNEPLDDSEEFSFSVPSLYPEDSKDIPSEEFSFSVPSLYPEGPKPLTPEQENIKKIDAEKDEGWFFDVNSRAGDLLGSFGTIAKQTPGIADYATEEVYRANKGWKQLLTGEVEFVDDEGDWAAKALGYKNWSEGIAEQEKSRKAQVLPSKYDDVEIPLSELIGGGLGALAGGFLGGGPPGMLIGGSLGSTLGGAMGDYFFPDDKTTTKEVAEAVQSAGSSMPSLAAGATAGYATYKLTRSPAAGALTFGVTSALTTIPLVFGSSYERKMSQYLESLQKKNPNYTKENWQADKQRILATGLTVEESAIENAAWQAGIEGFTDFVTNSLIALPGKSFNKFFPKLYTKTVGKQSAVGKGLGWVSGNLGPRITAKVGFDVAGEIGQETAQTQIESQYDTSLGLASKELTYGEAFNKVRTQTMIAALVGSGPLTVAIETAQHVGKVKEKEAFKKALSTFSQRIPKDPVDRYTQLIAMKEGELLQLNEIVDEITAQSDLLDTPLPEDLDNFRSDIQFIIEQRKAGPEAFVNPPDEDIAIGESSPEDLITLAKRFEDERAQENQNKREYSPEQEEPTPEGVQPEDLTSLAERVEQEQLSENKAFNEYRFGPGGLQAADAEALQGRVEQEKISEAKVLENFEEEAKQTAGTDIIGDVIDSDSDTSGGFGELEQELAYMMKRAEAAPEVEQESLQEEIPETLETKETNLTSELFLADPEKYINEILPLKTDEEITDIMVDGLTNPQMAYAMQDEGFKSKWEAVLAKKEESTKTAEPKEIKVNPEIAEINEEIKDHENIPGEETRVKNLRKRKKSLQVSDSLEKLDTDNPPPEGQTEKRLLQTAPSEVLFQTASKSVLPPGGSNLKGRAADIISDPEHSLKVEDIDFLLNEVSPLDFEQVIVDLSRTGYPDSFDYFLSDNGSGRHRLNVKTKTAKSRLKRLRKINPRGTTNVDIIKDKGKLFGALPDIIKHLGIYAGYGLNSVQHMRKYGKHWLDYIYGGIDADNIIPVGYELMGKARDMQEFENKVKHLLQNYEIKDYQDKVLTYEDWRALDGQGKIDVARKISKASNGEYFYGGEPAPEMRQVRELEHKAGIPKAGAYAGAGLLGHFNSLVEKLSREELQAIYGGYKNLSARGVISNDIVVMFEDYKAAYKGDSGLRWHGDTKEDSELFQTNPREILKGKAEEHVELLTPETRMPESVEFEKRVRAELPADQFSDEEVKAFALLHEALAEQAIAAGKVDSVQGYFDSISISDLSGQKVSKKFENVKGMITPHSTGAVISFFKTGDYTTMVHESGHLLKRILTPSQLNAMEKAYGVKEGDTWGEGLGSPEEQFAEDFEGYMAGKTKPRGALKRVFDDILQFLGKLYNKLAPHIGLADIKFFPEAMKKAVFSDVIERRTKAEAQNAGPNPLLDRYKEWKETGGVLSQRDLTPEEEKAIAHYTKTGEILPSHPRHEEPSSSEKARKILEAPITEEDVERAEAAYAEARKHREESGVFTQMFPEPLGASSPHGVKELVDSIIKDAGGVKNVKDLDFLKRVLVFLSRGLDTYSFSEWQRYVGILEEVAPHLSEQEKQFFDTEYFGGFADELVGLFGERSDFDWRIENMLKIKEYPQAYEIINKVREAFWTRNKSDFYSIIASQFAGAPSAEIVPFGDFKEMGYEQASDIPEYVAVRSKDTGDVVMFRREDLTFYYEYDDSQSFEEGLALDGGEFLGYYNGAPDKHFITVEKGDYQTSNTLFQTRHTFKDSPVIEHEIPTAPTNKTGRPKEPRKMQKALTKLIGSPIRWGKPPKSVRAKDWGFGFVDDHGTGQAYFEQGDLRGFLYAQGRLLDQRHHILNPTVVKNHGKELHNFLSTETQDLINAKYQADPNAFPDVETRIVQEGLSEFFTAYILNPAEAKKRAPGFATYFEKALPQKLGKNALTDIRGVSEDLRHYVTSDEGTTHVSTQDVIDGRTPSEPSWKSRSFFAQRLTNKAHALLDAFGDLAELAGEPATRMSQAHAGDPLKIMHDKMTAKEGVASIAKQMVDKGLVSYDYTRQVTEPFSKVFQLFGRIGEKNLVEKLDKSADIQMSLHVLEKVEQNNLALLGNAVDPIIGNLYALKDPNISSIVNTALGELYALVDSGQALDSANVYKPFGDMIANLRTSISNTSSLSSKKVDRLVGKIEQVLPDLIPTIEEIRDGQWNKARIVGMGVGEETDFARASRLVDSAKQDPEYAKMREAGQFIDKWFDGLFRMLVDADIYTEEFYKVVKSSNQQYFMLTRLMDPDSSFSDEVSAATQSPQGSDKYKDIIRRLEGSDKPVQNIYSNMLLNTYRTLNEIHKNDVRSYFVDMIEMAHRVSGEPVGHFGRKVHKGEPGSIPVVRKGVKDYWSFAPEIQEGFELVGTRLNLKMPFLPWYIRKVWKPLITLLPDFWIRNGISDFQNAPLVSKRKKVAGGLGFLAAPYMLGKHFLYTMPKALSKAAKRSQELTLGGGAVGHEGIHTQKDFENAVRESMKFAAKEKKFLILDPTNWAKGLGKILRGGLEISETINRLPELERGIEDAEAAGLGRRETLQSGASDSANILNFRTGGTWTEKMNTVTGFLVAQTKGIGSHIDAIARDPSSYLGLVLWSQIPLLMLERSMVADAEREDEFKEMPWYWKHVFWNIPAPRWMVEASGGWIQWINLPKAHTIGPIASAASEIAETYFRGEKMGDLDWQEAASLMMGSAMPSVTSVGGPMQSVIEVPLGYKFHPGSYYRSPTDPKLVSERNISKASKVSREAYYLAREKFGIDTVDPRDADHIVDKWVPKVGRAMLDISSIGETGKARAEDIMYKRLGILGTANPFSNRAVQGMLEEASKHKGLRATKEFKAFMDELQNITRKDILSPDWPERHKRISSRARSLKRYFEAVGKGKVKLGQIKQEIEEKKLQRGDR